MEQVKKPVLAVDEVHVLIDSIDTGSTVSLRDRALIGDLYPSRASGAIIKMRVEDIYVQGRCTWARLHEKGRKRHEMPCHHYPKVYLDGYNESAEIAADGRVSFPNITRTDKPAF